MKFLILKILILLNCDYFCRRFSYLNCDTDISPLLAKWDDPKMAQDPGVCEVVKQLDEVCREAGFFYVVKFSLLACDSISLFV